MIKIKHRLSFSLNDAFYVLLNYYEENCAYTDRNKHTCQYIG